MIVALGLVLGTLEFQSHVVHQISETISIPDATSAQLSLVAWITFFGGGMLYALLHMALAWITPSAQKPAWLTKMPVCMNFVGFLIWGSCIISLAKADLTLDSLYAVMSVGSLGAGMFVWGAYHHTITRSDGLSPWGRNFQTFMLLASPDIFRMLCIATNGPFDPAATPENYQDNYQKLMPILSMVGIILVMYSIGDMFSAISQLNKSRGGPFLPWRGLVKQAAMVGETIQNFKPSTFRMPSYDAWETASFGLFCMSAFFFAAAYTLRGVYAPLWLQSVTFSDAELNPVYTGEMMICTGSLIGKFFYSMTLEWRTESKSGLHLFSSYLVSGVLSIISLGSMIGYSAQLANTTGPHPYLATMFLYVAMQVGLGALLFEYVVHMAMYYDGGGAGSTTQFLGMFGMTTMMLVGPAVGFADSIRGSEVDSTGDPVVNFTTISYAVIGFFAASLVLNTIAKVLKSGMFRGGAVYAGVGDDDPDPKRAGL